MNTLRTTATLLALSSLIACGGGVPIELRIDEFTLELSLDDLVGELQAELTSSGALPLGTRALPEIWPDALPPIQTTLRMAAPPAPIDLTPDKETDPENYEKYKDINKAAEAVRRIEINRLVLRVEQSNLSLPIPELKLQVADDPTANPDDRMAWFTVGSLPGAEAGFIGDLDFDWITGGESFLNAQLGDEAKELAIRTVGELTIDTEQDPAMPRGLARLRLIVVATFFVEPEKAL